MFHMLHKGGREASQGAELAPVCSWGFLLAPTSTHGTNRSAPCMHTALQ